VLLAHNAVTATCDALARLLETSGVEVVDASSMDDARLALETETFDACLICLDLPPAPLGGARLAAELLERGCPVVLVTRSLRWLPPDATALRSLPWISPDATPDEVARAMASVSDDCDSGIRMRAGMGLELDALDTLESAPPTSRMARG
jgi:CheY-like chemotaxis protein